MHFTAAVTGLLALSSFVVAAPSEHSKSLKKKANDEDQPVPVPKNQPPNPGTGGRTLTNNCAARSEPKFVYEENGKTPTAKDCDNLSALLASGSIFGDYTKVEQKKRSWTSGTCQITMGAPELDSEAGDSYWVGSSDLSDLVQSAKEDFANAPNETYAVVGKKYTLQFLIGEKNTVLCQEVGGGRKQISVNYEVAFPVSGNTLPDKKKKKKTQQ